LVFTVTMPMLGPERQKNRLAQTPFQLWSQRVTPRTERVTPRAELANQPRTKPERFNKGNVSLIVLDARSTENLHVYDSYLDVHGEVNTQSWQDLLTQTTSKRVGSRFCVASDFD